MSTKTNRPKDHPLYQQRLTAWRPYMSMKDAATFFVVTGIVLIGIGIGMFIPDSAVVQSFTEYTNCNGTTDSCASPTSPPCICRLNVTISQNMTGSVYFYYAMTGYYQNHRKFCSSIDETNLMGQASPSSSCAPLINNSAGKYYAPCGQMANALFNDTFSLWNNDINATVYWTSANISLPSDRSKYAVITDWSNTVKPPNWKLPEYNRSSTAYSGDEELLVWLRPAALPSFKKLHRILINNGSFANGLIAGNYTLTVNYNYPVSSFGGRKFFVISNLSWLGGKNPAFTILYLTTGCVEFFIGLILFFMSVRHSTTRPQTNALVLQTKM